MTGTGHRIAGLCAYALVERGALLITNQPLEVWGATQLAAQANTQIPNSVMVPVLTGLLLAFNVLLVLLGALIPDLDHPESTIAHMLGPLWRLGLRLARLATRETLIGELFEHRGPSHSLAWWLAVNVPLAMLFFLIAPAFLSSVGAFAIGWLSHPFADGVTKEGMKFFWPVSQSRIRFVPEAIAARTGALSETLYLVVFVLVALSAWGVPALVNAVLRRS